MAQQTYFLFSPITTFDTPFSKFLFSATLSLMLANLEQLFSLPSTVKNKVEPLFSSMLSNFNFTLMFLDLMDKPIDFTKLNQKILGESINASFAKSLPKPAEFFQKRMREEEKGIEKEKKIKKSINSKESMPMPILRHLITNKLLKKEAMTLDLYEKGKTIATMKSKSKNKEKKTYKAIKKPKYRCRAVVEKK